MRACLAAVLILASCAGQTAKISQSATAIRQSAAQGRAALAETQGARNVPAGVRSSISRADASMADIEVQAARVADALPGVQDKPSSFLATLRSIGWWAVAVAVVGLLAYTGLLPVLSAVVGWIILRFPAAVHLVSPKVRDAVKLGGEALEKNPTPELAQAIAAQRAHSRIFDAVFRVTRQKA